MAIRQDVLAALAILLDEVPAVARLRPWDVRPERLIGPLSAVEGLLGEKARMGLEAPALPALSRISVQGHAPFWRAEKERVAASVLDRAPHLGLGDVLARLKADPDPREALTGALAARLARSTADPRPEVPAERIAVAFVVAS